MNLKLEILRELDAAKGLLIPEPRLQRDLVIITGTAISTIELRDALSELKEKKYISGVDPDLGGPAKWMITDQGRAAFQNAV